MHRCVVSKRPPTFARTPREARAHKHHQRCPGGGNFHEDHTTHRHHFCPHAPYSVREVLRDRGCRHTALDGTTRMLGVATRRARTICRDVFVEDARNRNCRFPHCRAGHLGGDSGREWVGVSGRCGPNTQKPSLGKLRESSVCERNVVDLPQQTRVHPSERTASWTVCPRGRVDGRGSDS